MFVCECVCVCVWERWQLSSEMEISTEVQILNEAVSVLLHANGFIKNLVQEIRSV